LSGSPHFSLEWTYELPAQISFHDWPEYLTVIGFGRVVKYEQEEALSQAIFKGQARCVQANGQPDNVYFALIDIDNLDDRWVARTGVSVSNFKDVTVQTWLRSPSKRLLEAVPYNGALDTFMVAPWSRFPLNEERNL
jgi:hypothetical protein